MLQSMRELSKSWIFKTLMALLVISFGIWGIGDMFRGNPAQETVGQVGSIKITRQQLENRFQLDMPEARKIFGAELTVAQARQMGLLDRALHMMQEEYSFDQEAQRLGIVASSETTLKRLANEPRFRDKDGKFNTELWHRTLAHTGYSEQMFLEVDSRNTARQIIIQAIVANNIIPQVIVDTMYQARGAKRIAEVISLRNDSIKNIPPATDAQLQAYYQDHENEFVAPEYRGLTIAQLATDEMTKDVTVSDEDVREAYAARAAELVVPERRDLLQIVVQDEAKAKAVADAAEKAQDLSQAAKTHGLTPITMKGIDEKSVLPELYASVFALEEGQVSMPIKSSLGWHVIQLKKLHESGKQSFDQVKDTLRKTLQEERVGDLVAKTVNQIDDSLAGGQSLEDLADTLKLHLTRYPALDAKGQTPEGTTASNIPEKDTILSTAFGLNTGETSQVIDDGKGNYYVARIDQITQSHVRPFDEAKKSITAAWLDLQLYEKAHEEAESMAKALREGKSATSFATRPGVEVRLSKSISLLGDTDKDLPESAIPLILSMKKGDVTTTDSPGKQFVLKLRDIVPVNPKRPDDTRIKIVEDLNEKLPQNLIESYSDDLHTTFPQTVNQGLLTTLKAQASDSEK